MRSSLLIVLVAVVVVVVVSLAAEEVSAHGHIVQGTAAGSIGARTNVDASGAPANGDICGHDAGGAPLVKGPVTKSFNAGDSVTLDWNIINNHGQSCQVLLSRTGLDTDFEILVPPFACAANTGSESRTFTLPEDLDCDSCTIKWNWSPDGGYNGCADIEVRAGLLNGGGFGAGGGGAAILLVLVAAAGLAVAGVWFINKESADPYYNSNTNRKYTSKSSSSSSDFKATSAGADFQPRSTRSHRSNHSRKSPTRRI